MDIRLTVILLVAIGLTIYLSLMRTVVYGRGDRLSIIADLVFETLHVGFYLALIGYIILLLAFGSSVVDCENFADARLHHGYPNELDYRSLEDEVRRKRILANTLQNCEFQYMQALQRH